jgi:hypothetical protein
MASLFDWSSTAANNTAVDSININTGMSPANVDNALRSIMALIRATFSSGLQTFLAGSSALPVANGGTGATTIAGVLTAIGALADTYRDLPITTKSSSFTLADTDRATALNYTGSGGTATIDSNSTTAITTGATIVVRNAGTGNLTITRGSGVTLKSNGSTTSANATLAAGGVCTLVKWGTNDWSCTGSGLS